MTASSRTPWPSPAALAVFVLGLVAAAASGVATYRAVGLYGGPMQTGFYREWDPNTGRYLLRHQATTKDGVTVRRELADNLSLERMTLTLGPDAAAPIADSAGRVAFSTSRDGVIDAWAIRDAEGQTARVEVSTRRDGRIDRWERYDKGQLVRVDLDTNGNGKPDRWMTYQDGILMDTFVDADEDGQPDGPVTR
jgi:hypothetical protein